jgi:hypothetical protein
VWLSRELEFAVADPGAERWEHGRLHHRSAGGRSAILAAPRAATTCRHRAGTPAPPGIDVEPRAAVLELRGLTGTGLTSGTWRWGAESRPVCCLAISSCRAASTMRWPAPLGSGRIVTVSQRSYSQPATSVAQ